MRVEPRALAAAALAVALWAGTAVAEPINNPIAVFAGLDKITGLITTFEVPIDKTYRFGSLDVRPRACHTRPVTEPPKTIAFVQVDDHLLDGSVKRIFSGWMLAESPGLNAVEHPVYDVWLTGCRNPAEPPPQQEAPPKSDVPTNSIPENGN